MENSELIMNFSIDNSNAKESIKEVKEEIEELIEVTEELELPNIRPIINFYGCSFNFGYDGCAESRYYNGDDIYNPRKEI